MQELTASSGHSAFKWKRLPAGFRAGTGSSRPELPFAESAFLHVAEQAIGGLEPGFALHQADAVSCSTRTRQKGTQLDLPPPFCFQRLGWPGADRESSSKFLCRNFYEQEVQVQRQAHNSQPHPDSDPRHRSQSECQYPFVDCFREARQFASSHETHGLSSTQSRLLKGKAEARS